VRKFNYKSTHNDTRFFHVSSIKRQYVNELL